MTTKGPWKGCSVNTIDELRILKFQSDVVVFDFMPLSQTM